jgi:hypothetical protein
MGCSPHKCVRRNEWRSVLIVGEGGDGGHPAAENGSVGVELVWTPLAHLYAFNMKMLNDI